MMETTEVNEELIEVVEHQVSKGQEPLRIDKYLVDHIRFITRNKIQSAIKVGNIKVNENKIKANYKVRPLDNIQLIYPKSDSDQKLKAEDIPLDIIFEDEEVIVLNKPKGLVVHPGVGNKNGTLANALLFHHQNFSSKSVERGRPGIIHRLDKDTSGIMVIGKTEWATAILAKQFFNRTIHRKYHALVWGDFDDEDGKIIGNIGRHDRFRQKMTVYEEEDKGKHAVTHYKVLKRMGYVTLVECKLETGRTHQIRVHFKHINRPVFGDKTYDGDRIVKGTVFTKYKQFIDNCFKLMPSQALHAAELGFDHPNGEEMFFTSEKPENFEKLLTKWDDYTKSHM